MSKIEKEINRLKSKTKDYTYDELKSILIKLGFCENNKGKTSGSRVIFIDCFSRKIELHRPHPNNIIKNYKINDIVKKLEEWGII